MSMTNLIRAIREKHVGTSQEHDLLRLLGDDVRTIEIEVENRVRENWEQRMDALSANERRTEYLQTGALIDVAVFEWLQRQQSGDEWYLEVLARAMTGRGLTADHLRQIADAMEKAE